MVKVSVIVVTYNHEAYIKDALQSILDQEVNFKYEIIVANDASTDRTKFIIDEFVDKYPDVFVAKHNTTNLGVLGNVISLIQLIKGEYFALLDGDDYWKYPYKLQKQIDFLDAHQEYNAVFHDAEIKMMDEGAEQKLFFHKYLYSQAYDYKEVIHPTDMVNRLILPSSAAVFRTKKEVIPHLKALIIDDYSIKWKLACLLIRHSKFYFFNEVWSVYRNHSKGISKSKNKDFHFSHIDFLKSLKKDEFYKDYPYDIHRAIAHEYTVLLNSHNDNPKSLFFKFLGNEMKRLYYYYKTVNK